MAVADCPSGRGGATPTTEFEWAGDKDKPLLTPPPLTESAFFSLSGFAEAAEATNAASGTARLSLILVLLPVDTPLPPVSFPTVPAVIVAAACGGRATESPDTPTTGPPAGTGARRRPAGGAGTWAPDSGADGGAAATPPDDDDNVDSTAGSQFPFAGSSYCVVTSMGAPFML